MHSRIDLPVDLQKSPSEVVYSSATKTLGRPTCLMRQGTDYTSCKSPQKFTI